MKKHDYLIWMNGRYGKQWYVEISTADYSVCRTSSEVHTFMHFLCSGFLLRRNEKKENEDRLLILLMCELLVHWFRVVSMIVVVAFERRSASLKYVCVHTINARCVHAIGRCPQTIDVCYGLMIFPSIYRPTELRRGTVHSFSHTNTTRSHVIVAWHV